jgi:cyanophycin synthetase
MTSRTGALAVDIAGDKDMTIKLLGSAGLPVPKQETCRTGSRRGRRPADRFPVVVKPLDGNHGRGVGLNLMSDDEVRAASPWRRRSRAAGGSSSSPSSPARTTAA